MSDENASSVVALPRTEVNASLVAAEVSRIPLAQFLDAFQLSDAVSSPCGASSSAALDPTLLSRIIGFARRGALRHGFVRAFATAANWHEVTGFTIFMASQRIDVTAPEQCENASTLSCLRRTAATCGASFRLLYVGSSSYATEAVLHVDDTAAGGKRHVIGRVVQSLVRIDLTTRRPSALTEESRLAVAADATQRQITLQATAPLTPKDYVDTVGQLWGAWQTTAAASGGSGLSALVLAAQATAGCFAQRMVLRGVTDFDFNDHLNQSIYLYSVREAIVAAARRGTWSGAEGAEAAHVLGLRVDYLKELRRTAASDVLRMEVLVVLQASPLATMGATGGDRGRKITISWTVAAADGGVAEGPAAGVERLARGTALVRLTV